MIFNDLDKQCRRTTIYYMNSDHKSSPFVDSCNPTLKKASLPGAFLLLAITLLIATPLATEAKNSKYAFGKSRDYSVSATLGTVDTSDGIFKLSALTVSSSKKIETEINLYDTIAFIRINPARPWHIFSRPKNIDLTISGLTSGKTYYLYQERLRNPDIFVADQNGSHIISLDTPRHRYLVLKTKPSTLHIDASGGQDCNSIGSWDQPSLTCILSTTLPINDIIEIDDAGITLDGSNRLITHTNNIGVYANTLPLEPAITGITIKNIRLAGLDVGVALYNTSNVSFENVTVKSDTTGIQLGDTTGVYMFHSTIWSNSTGFITNNNTNIFINRTNWKGNTVDIDPSVGTLDLTSDTTNRGNWWSKNTNCQQTDSAHPNYCTNSFSTGHGVDSMPWACEDGWGAGSPCSRVVPPPTGSGLRGEVSATADTGSLYSDQTLTNKIKTLPDGWALKVLDSSSNPVKVHDSTDNVDGYIKSDDIKIAAAGSATETELQNNAEVIYDTKDKRVPVILDAVNLYHDNPNGTKTLYDPAGGIDGGNKFPDFIADGSVPKELLLAIAKKETGGHGLNNEVCNDGLDGGVGIMQLTPYRVNGVIEAEPRGSGSGMRNIQRVGDCYSGSGWDKQTSSYYSNTKQGIYANIKDGYRTFQIKYNTFGEHVDAYEPQKSSWFSDDTVSVNNTDLKVILAVRGYRGFGPKCFRFNNELEYPRLIADSLSTLSTTFPDVTYDNSDSLVEKLRLAEKNKVSIDVCSPGDLSILDSVGRKTGYVLGNIEYQIPNIVYDEVTHKSAIILFPQENYRFSIKGDETGVYTLYVVNYASGLEFKAISISIALNEVHEYTVDWSKLNSPNGVKIKVDTNGDGTFDRTINSDGTLTSDEFSKQSESKVTLCHVPSGNPGNAHTLSVGASAVKAHLGHGDKLGECIKEKEKEHGDNNDNKKNDGKGEVKGASTGKDKKDKHK